MLPSGHMKLLCLNTWGGRAGLPGLLAFFKQNWDVDIFCLQEVWNGGEHTLDNVAAGQRMLKVDFQLLRDIRNVLPHHAPHFLPQYLDFFGMAMFIHKDCAVIDTHVRPIYREPGYISPDDIADHGRLLQAITINIEQGPRTIMQTHGAWQPGGKKDTPERLLQSQKILEFSRELSHPSILCGDLNLSLNNESIRLLEEGGFKNLVREYNIISTRTSLYIKPERHADYIFASEGIQVQDFCVLPDEVSDHSALLLTWS